MPSLKRARSEGPDELAVHVPLSKRRRQTRGSWALTRANLDRLQRSLSPSCIATPPPTAANFFADMSSPSRPSNPLHERQKLDEYGVHVDRGHAFPTELDTLLRTTIRQPRNPNETASPNAKNIASRRRFAADQIERDGIRHIAPLLLFTGEAEMPTGTAGEPLVISKDEIILHKFFLPKAPDVDVKRTWGDLKEARVDRGLGYVSRRDAESSGCAAPFTAQEEKMINNFCLTQRMYFPFLTSQWKAANSGENLAVAQIQAARDGACIVNYLDAFYSVANGTSPSPALACHFSLTCDLNSVEIWVHWKEGQHHHMEHVYSCLLRDEGPQLLQARAILKNILEYARQDRLRAIKEALSRFAQNRASFPPIVTPASTHTSESHLSLAEAGRREFTFATPTTPRSVASEPVKKRARTEDSGFYEK